MSPEERNKFVQEMIDIGLRIEREGITVDSAFMKLRKGENQSALTIQNRLTGDNPLTTEEIAQLARIPMTGILEVVGTESGGGVAGATKHVRLRVIMHGPVAAPIEFFLPVEGSLLIIQLDDQKWITIPQDYARSSKTVAIKPAGENATFIDYDIGNGRVGGERYSWGR